MRSVSKIVSLEAVLRLTHAFDRCYSPEVTTYRGSAVVTTSNHIWPNPVVGRPLPAPT
jgi:hypothetical protein